MAMIKKRPVALIITLLVIMLSTMYSANRTLGAACQEISDSFYVGVYDSTWGAKHKSVSSQLEKSAESALGLLSVAAKYDAVSDEAEVLRSARIALIGAKDIRSKYTAYKELIKAFNGVHSAIISQDLADRDKSMVSEYSSDFRGAQSVIENSGYNEAVREFERSTLNVFPTNILKVVAFVKTPQLFE